MREPTTIIFDTETTGLVPGVDKVIEFAALALNSKREVVDQVLVYIDPGREIPLDAYRVHGMDRAYLLEHGALPFNEAWPQIEDFIKRANGSLWVAHNASYDLTMMQSEIDEMNDRQWVKKEAGPLEEGKEDIIFKEILEKYGPSGQCDVLDSILLARRVEYELSDNDPDYVDLSIDGDDVEDVKEGKQKTSRRKFKLDYVAKRFGIDLSERSEHHEALIDCKILANVYFKLLEVDKKHGSKFAKIHELKLTSRNDPDRVVLKRTTPITKW